jgi:hypothetical protein
MIAAACVCLGPGRAPAEQASPDTPTLRIADLHAGFAGRFKVGYWAPFTIELAGGNDPQTGRVELVVPDGDGVPSRVHFPPTGILTLGRGERRSVSLSAKIGRLSGEVTVGFRTSAGLVASRRFTMGAEGPLAGALASSETLVVSVGLGAASSAPPVRHAEIAALESLTELPDEWWGYEGVDAVILATGDERFASQLAAAGRKIAALDLWVRLGGKLVLSAGRSAEKVLAADSSLAPLAPGKLDSIVALRQSAAIENFAEAAEPLSAGGPLALEIARLADVRGRVEAFSGTHARDLPLVVRTPRGFGEVVFAAFDLAAPPITNWPARPRLFDKLLGRPTAEAATEQTAALGAVATLGFTDLAGQLRAALDQFAGVRLVPFWLVALLVTAYIACIGPLDYFLVKRVFRRMEATWLSFGVMVVLFGAGACALAYGLKGREVRANQVDLVDFDAESGLVRGTSWSAVFSPANDTYNLTIKLRDAGRAEGEMLFSWFGLPGTGFGAMDSPARAVGGLGTAEGFSLFTDPYDFSGRLDALEHVPIGVWSSKAFVARWWNKRAADLDAQLSDTGRLAGTLTSRRDAPLSDCVLIYGKWAYVIGALAPGRVVDFDAIDPQTANTYLRHVTVRGDRQVAAPYDRASFDVPRIVEMMTAHGLADGEKYTTLEHRYEGTSEITPLVLAGRAVLLARAGRPATELARDGRPLAPERTGHWTFHRYVFPVAEQPAK